MEKRCKAALKRGHFDWRFARRIGLVACSSIGALCWSNIGMGSALAQTMARADPPASTDIVVTAQRRAERLQDVPITMTQVSGAALDAAGVTGTANLSQVVPAFRLDHNGGYAQPAIRGVTTSISNPGSGSNIAVYVDGFYNPSPLTTDFEFLNISGVQVLKGPQGTLFGRNSTGGAVIVTTTAPSTTLAARGQVEYSRYDTVRTSAYLTGGLSSNLAADIGLLYSRSDGFLTKLSTGDDEIGGYDKFAVRAGLKLDLGEDYVLLRGGYSRAKDSSGVNYSIYRAPNGRYMTAADAFAVPGATWGRARGETDSDPGLKPVFRNKSYYGQLTGKFDVGFATLTTYTQYRDEKSLHDLDIDGSNSPIFHATFPNYDKTFTQEILLNGPSEARLDWVVGAFYMRQKSGQTLSFVAPALGEVYGIRNRIESIAGFADLTYEAIDKLFLTAGARVSHETNRGGWTCFPSGPLIGTPCPGVDLRGSWDNVSPRAVVRYQFDPHANIYASVSFGYKAGIIDPNGFQLDPVDPEKLVSYEAGVKYGNAGIQFSLSGFVYSYKDLQQYQSTGTASITTNAARSTIYGAEMSGSFTLAPGFTIDGGLAWTHARYDSYETAPANIFDFAAGQVSTAPVDASNNPMIRAPDWSGNLAATYALETNSGRFTLNANLYATSKVYFDPANQFRQKGYALLNARLNWTMPNERFTLGIFGNNLTDTRYRTQVLPNGFGVGEIWGTPRTYGVTAGFNF